MTRKSVKLTNNGVRLTQLWVIFRVKLTDFRVIVVPGMEFGPNGPFSGSRWHRVFLEWSLWRFNAMMLLLARIRTFYIANTYGQTRDCATMHEGVNQNQSNTQVKETSEVLYGAHHVCARGKWRQTFTAYWKREKKVMRYTNTDCPPKNYNRNLGIDCERTLYGIWKIKSD